MRSIILLLIASSLFNYALAQKKKTPGSSLAEADSAFMRSDYSRSIILYEEILKDKKTAGDAQPWYRLGQSYHRTHDYKHAIVAYSEAEKLNPRLPGLWLNTAKAFSASGDVTTAEQRIDIAIKNGFSNDKILAEDPDFENLRKTDSFKAIKERVYNNSHPCANLPAAHAFDFWIGDWDVYLTSDRSVKTGTNHITSQSGGCVIMESWEAQGPHTGVSLSYFDPVNGKWKQKWAGSSQDIQEFYDGEYSDGLIAFKYDGKNPDGTSFMGKLTFTKMPSGDVRQHSQQSNDGKSWTDGYDFIYVRRK